MQLPSSFKMCYYECFRFSCDDWKIGNFKEHCTKEYRRGETCGLKLIAPDMTYQMSEKCTVCQRIERKQNRLRKECERYKRWEAEGRLGEVKATAEKLLQDIQKLQNEVTQLNYERAVVRNSHAHAHGH